MKNITLTIGMLFLFAVKVFAQRFNSVLSVEPINTIAVKKEVQRDTIKPNIAKDTTHGFEFVPDKEPLQLACLPVSDIHLTSGFGYRIHPILGSLKFHNGIDLSVRHANVYSVLHGIVEYSGYDNIIGNYVIVNHGNYETTYGHLSVRFVKPGDLVKAGTVVGISGRTGRVTGEHLHFIVRYNGQTVNPLPFLKTILSVHETNQLTDFLTQNK